MGPLTTRKLSIGQALMGAWLGAVLVSSPAAAQKVAAHQLSAPGTGQYVRHLTFTPSNYDAEPERQWPLIVALHGTAGKPEDVMGFQRLQELAERYGYLVVCPHSSGVGELHRRYVMAVLRDTEERYRVDSGRVFLLGFSRGGAGVWQLAFEHPQRWAALAPISPATRSKPNRLEELRHVPVIVTVGDRDRAVSVPVIRRWVRQMAKLGMRHQFVELPGLEHDLSRVNFLPVLFEFFERQSSSAASQEMHLPGTP